MKIGLRHVVLAFVVGAILGVLGAWRCTPYGFGGKWQDPEKFHQRMMQKFTSRLMLTTEQQQKVSVILEDARTKIEVLRQETHPKFKEIRDEGQTKIRQLLTPEQQKRFDEMNTEMKARLEKHQGKHHREFEKVE
jgi:Spy/CpxP family protein refolding chaperone